MYTTWRRRNEVQKSRNPEVQKSRSPEVQKSIIQKSSSQKKWKMRRSSFSFLPHPSLSFPSQYFFTVLYCTNCIAL